MGMKFYNSVGPNPRVVKMFMAERGVTIPEVEIDLRGGENRRAPYNVSVNPAVVAPISLEKYLGPQTNLYTHEPFEFTLEHVAQLRALEVPRITPSRYLLMVETGDEVLDYRQAVARYAGCRQIVLPGGDHSFTRFPEYVAQLIEFCGL